MKLPRRPTSLEICAGAGGAALGLEQAGFRHLALIEIDKDACATLRHNRPLWDVRETDLTLIDGSEWAGKVDLLSGGVPCQPFSIGGHQRGAADDRDLFPDAIRLIREIRPKAVLLENVPGLGGKKFNAYRSTILEQILAEGYDVWWDIIRADDHGVPQTRPRLVLVGIRQPWAEYFQWPKPAPVAEATVGNVLYPLMASRGWPGAEAWRDGAQGIGGTLTGNAGKTGGGPDLGHNPSKRAWASRLGVNARGIADEPPGPEGLPERTAATGMPMLTVPMTALLQGFPADWEIQGRKTTAYRQVSHAFPPPVARVLAYHIRLAFDKISA